MMVDALGLLLLLLAAAPIAAVQGRPPHFMHLATSASGSVVLGAAYEDGVYLSRDSGKTFARAPVPSTCALCTGCRFNAVAASSTANLLFAAGVYDGIYRSIDGGSTWAATNAPKLAWQQSMACSETGRHVYALTTTCSGSSDALGNACSMYGVYRSENNGAHWVRSGAPALNWKAVAVSSDGQRVVAAAAGNGIYRSADFGKTWAKTLAPVASYIDVAVSGDATSIVAIAYGDISVHLTSNEFSAAPIWTRKPVYTSNSAPWQPWITSSTHSWHNWRSVVRSQAGDRLAMVSAYGFFYLSKNNGTNIDPNAYATPAKDGVAHSAGWEWWVALAGSADGKHLYAAETLNGALYTSTNYGSGAWTRLTLPKVVC